MKLLFDARAETMYPLGKEGFSGGSQVYIKAITEGLANRGHEVHVITNDLETDKRLGETLWYWPPTYFPHEADIAVMQMHARNNPEYEAPIAILMTSCVDPWLGPNHEFAPSFDAIPCFSETHKRLLCGMRPVRKEKCFVTGLGVELADYVAPVDPGGCYTNDCGKAYVHNHYLPMLSYKVPGRMLYANDPARGLFYVLDIFDLVKRKVPEATLHVAYNFDQQLEWRKWEHSHMAQMLWECKRRIETTPGIVNLNALTRAEIIREQLECQVHCMPSDPPGIGTQTHGITQMECAAAGCALILSDVEAFPEVFGEAAIILPVVGRYEPALERRITTADYAEVVIELMQDGRKWADASHKARMLAEQNTWDMVIDKWEAMLAKLSSGVVAHA